MNAIDGMSEHLDAAEKRRMRKIAHATRAYFAALGVSFDPLGRPQLPGMAVDIAGIERVNADAAEAAYLALEAAVRTAQETEGEWWLDEMVMEAFGKAFNAGAEVEVTVFDRKLKRAVHAVDRETGECTGRLPF